MSTSTGPWFIRRKDGSYLITHSFEKFMTRMIGKDLLKSQQILRDSPCWTYMGYHPNTDSWLIGENNFVEIVAYPHAIIPPPSSPSPSDH